MVEAVLFTISVLYFGPSLFASAYRLRSSMWIWPLNLFLGWTVVGWIALLIIVGILRRRDLRRRDEKAV